MPEGDLAVLDERNGHRRPHAGGARVAVRAVVHAPIGLLDQGDDPLLSPLVRTALLQRSGRAPHPLSSRPAAGSRDATSPACAPPIPSATAKSGGSTT